MLRRFHNRRTVAVFLIVCIFLPFLINFFYKRNTISPFEKHGSLCIKDNQLLDEKGRVFDMRGVCVTTSSPDNEFINKDTFRYLRNQCHVNTIRICVVTEGKSGICSSKQKEDIVRLVEEGIGYCTELGMYVILDWHILTDGNPLKHMNSAKAFFNYFTSQYGNQNNILYEICNEPNGKYGTWKNIRKYVKTIIPIIRSNNKNSVVIIAPPNWAQDVGIVLKEPIDLGDNIAYSYHFYSGSHKGDMREQLDNAYISGLPIIVTEFGISQFDGKGPVDIEEADRWISLLDQYHIGRVAFVLGRGEKDSCFMIRPTSDKKEKWKKEDLTIEGQWFLEGDK